jgi:hypothetical protein
VSSRVKLTPLLLLLSLLGCGSPRTLDLTIGGTPVDDPGLSVRSTLDPTDTETTIDVRITAPGPAGVSDAGMTFVFRVSLAAGPAAGDVLDAQGHATLVIGPSFVSTPTELTFDAAPGSDERFHGLFAWTECFCGTMGTFDEGIVAHVEILDVTVGTITFSIEADVTGRIPGRGTSEEHQVLHGTFTAERPTL